MRNTYKFLSGIFACGVGGLCIWGSLDFDLGQLRNMGPGFYPLMLGILTTILGISILILPVSEDEAKRDAILKSSLLEMKTHIRPWLCVAGGFVVFIIIGVYGGFVPATFMLVFICALGDRENTPVSSLVLGIITSIFAVSVFYYAMRIQFPLWNWG